MQSTDLISIGDATVDVFMTPTETETLCQVDTKECFIAFSYGDKIPVKSLEFSVGGNAANNAVGARRLSVNSTIVSTVGDDSVGEMIAAKLKSESVEISNLVKEANSESNYSTVVSYQGERTIFVYHAPRTYRFPDSLVAAPWVYLTSMGENFQDFYTSFVAWSRANPTTKIAFNPGTWQLKDNSQTLKEVLSLTQLLYVNRKEAEKISGFTNSHGREKELLMATTKLGPKSVVITDGGGGSFAFDGIRFLACSVLPIDPYERTGAGDAFGVGCLSALIKGKSFDEALIWGTANSASVIGYTGSQKGLLKDSEMPVWLDRARSSGIKVREF